MRGTRTLLCVSTAAIALALCGGGVHRTAAEAPSTTAWWSVAGAANGAPVPPDVKPGDLLVEGVGGAPPAVPSAPAAPVPVPAPVPGAPAAPVPAPPPPSGAPVPGLPTGGAPVGAFAVAALRFPVAEGAQVGTLTLGLDGLKPPAIGIVACPITAPFKPAENGPLSDVPPFDCTTSDTATLSKDGSTIGFAHLAPMVRGGSLSVLLLPGAADRVVLSRPTAAALAVIPAPPEPPGDLGPVPALPPPAAAPPPAASAPVLAPVTAAPPPAPRHHHLRHRTLAVSPVVPQEPARAPRTVLLATLAAVAALAVILGRPTAAAGAQGFHRFSRIRSGPAPRV